MNKLTIIALLVVGIVYCGFAPDEILSLPIYGELKSKNYAGYIDTDTKGRKAFYWFVESQNKPSTDPLVLWLNGGPGCSSLLGLTEENGPYTMRHGGSFENNEFTYATLANMLYIESPPGVGFAVDSVPPTVWDDVNTAQYNYNALIGFFEKFPEYGNHSLYLAGESYAGHYVPQLAEKIFDGPDANLRKMMKGFMVGNPCTGDIGCNNPDPTLLPYLQYQGFAALNPKIPQDPNANYDPYDLLVPTCDTQSVATRSQRFENHPVLDALRTRMENIKKRLGDAPWPYGPCADNYVTAWLNRADVKADIHAWENITWVECSNTLNYTFNSNGVLDIYRKLMDKTDWNILVYSGLSDSVVNQAQTQTLISSLNRTLVDNMFKGWYYPYVYDNTQLQLGGFYLHWDRISWAGVRDAGHMVPQFNPPEALELFHSFLAIGRPGRLQN